MSFLIPELFVLFLSDLLILAFFIICLPISIDIAKYWNLSVSTEKQYSLEKKAYLVSTVIKFALAIQLPLFMLFIYANDKMSNVVTGAMCAAGVINAVIYGKYLLYIKILNIFTFSLWLVLNSNDYASENMPYTKTKFRLFPVLFLFLCVEIVLFILNYSKIDPTQAVSCCNVLFSSDSSTLLTIKGSIAFIIFSGCFLSLLILYFAKLKRLYAIFSGLYFFISVITLINFTSTYVYELPTHKCPFCILQSGYYYVGYLFYIFLFVGTFGGFAQLINGKNEKIFMKISLIFNSLFYLLSALYPIRFYLINHTWL